MNFFPVQARVGAGILLFSTWGAVAAETNAPAKEPTNQLPTKPLSEVLPRDEWHKLEKSVDRALAWLATQQLPDGSFPSIDQGQPGVTSLCVMAFLSRGHQPDIGPYGERINRAVDYVLSCQMADGLFSRLPPEAEHVIYNASHTAGYNHPIAGLMLGEVYGQMTGEREERVKDAITKALAFSRALQTRPKGELEKGGWRYIRWAEATDSDLSTTTWQLMFLRSAKNAEFDVPQQYVDEGLAYIARCWDPQTGSFFYTISGGNAYITSRGLAGVGIVALTMGGRHQTDMAVAAGDFLLRQPFTDFGAINLSSQERFFYTTYYCSQAAAQLGGNYWEGIFPPLSKVLLGAQQSDGSWPPEGGGVGMFGNCLTTAMAVLALTPPYQLLPVYQR